MSKKSKIKTFLLLPFKVLKEFIIELMEGPEENQINWQKSEALENERKFWSHYT